MKSTLCWLSALLILAIGVARFPEAQASQEEDIREVFGRLDANRDKRLSEDEFVGEKGGKARANARKKFRTLDENGDRWLSLHEFKRAGRHE
jgi:hypothetical protein